MYEYKKEDFNGDDEKESIYFLATKIINEESKTVTYQNGLIYYDSGVTGKNYVFFVHCPLRLLCPLCPFLLPSQVDCRPLSTLRLIFVPAKIPDLQQYTWESHDRIEHDSQNRP